MEVADSVIEHLRLVAEAVLVYTQRMNILIGGVARRPSPRPDRERADRPPIPEAQTPQAAQLELAFG